MRYLSLFLLCLFLSSCMITQDTLSGIKITTTVKLDNKQEKIESVEYNVETEKKPVIDQFLESLKNIL